MSHSAQARLGENCNDRKNWQTPPAVFLALDREFGFTLDAAADDRNALCPDYFTAERSGFDHDWSGRVFCNPPYGGREIPKWHDRAFEQTRENAELAVLLVPANVDTKAFQMALGRAAEIRLVGGRIAFVLPDGTQPTSPPGNNAVVIYRRGHDGPAKVVGWPNPQRDQVEE